jgi:hypothetical protein
MYGCDDSRMIIVVGLVVFALVFFGGIVAAVWYGIFKVEHDRKVAEKNSAAILDDAFDGRSDVTFKIHMRSLKYETVLAGAKARGYKVAHQAGDPSRAMTLVFEKEAVSRNDIKPPATDSRSGLGA